MKISRKFVWGQLLSVGLVFTNTTMAQNDQAIDKVSGRMDYEFQQMTEQDALGDINTLRQFITDSLRLLYDEKYQQEIDSLESVYAVKIQNLQADLEQRSAMNKTLIDSLANRSTQKDQPLPAAKAYDARVEARYFEYLKTLKLETPRRKTSFLKMTSTVENIAPFQIEELHAYFEQYFPEAHSDSILDFIIQINIRESDWTNAERNILKFLYLFPNSSLYEEIKTVRSLIFQNEKYFKSYSNILNELVTNAPQLPQEDIRYFRYIELLKDFPDLAVRSSFIPEAQRFLELYPNSKYAPDAILWLAQAFLDANQPHSAYLYYQRMMIVYPDNVYYVRSLHASGVIQERQFNEFTNALATFSSLIQRFPNDSLAENAQYRIAKINDDNLNDWERAIWEYQTFADKYPQSPKAVPALMRKAVIQNEKMNMVEESIKTYKSIDERYPSTTSAEDALTAAAELYYTKTRYDQAIEVYMSIFQKYPQSEKAVTALEKVGEIYQTKIKDNQKAIEIQNMIITNYPNTKASAKATKALQKLEKVK